METRDIIIIGAGPAGLSAAIFTSLDAWNTLIYEGNWVGGQAAIAYTVMNYPGFLPDDGKLLIDTMEKQITTPLPKGVGAEIRREMVTELDADKKIITTAKDQYQAKAIILATGSTMQTLGFAEEEKFIGKGITYYAKNDYEKFSGKKVLVVGGGNTTAKSALLAKTTAQEVLLIHRRDAMRAYAPMVKKLGKQGVNILYNTEIKEIKGDDVVRGVVLINNTTKEEKDIEIDWIVICAGTEPNITLAEKAGLAIANSLVKVDHHMMTSKPGIFACGEITGCDKHLISSASNGASTGMAASEYLAMEKIKKGEKFTGAKNGKYADEYIAMLKQAENK